MTAVRGQAVCGGAFDPVMLTINRAFAAEPDIDGFEAPLAPLAGGADMTLEAEIGLIEVDAFLDDLGVGEEDDDEPGSGSPYEFDSALGAPKFIATNGTPLAWMGEIGAYAVDYELNLIWGPKSEAGWPAPRGFIAGEGLGSVVPQLPLDIGDIAVFRDADGNVIGSGGPLTATGQTLTSAESPEAARTAIGAVSEDDVVGLAIVFGS